MSFEYYPRRLTNFPRKKREDHHTLISQGWIIELFTPYKLFSCLLNLIDSLPGFRLETCLKIILQVTCFSCQIVDSRKNMSREKQKNVFKNKRQIV